MHTTSNKTPAPENRSVARSLTQLKQRRELLAPFVDNRPEALAQTKLTNLANNSPQVRQAAQLHATANGATNKKPQNNTGLPNQLKAGIENLSGFSMDDVTVHRNSAQPAQLQAHAYAQGTDIHLAPGQEKHLPHEAWHVVQQKQGRVKPTLQMKDKVNINDDVALEREADVMGIKATQLAYAGSTTGAQVLTNKFLKSSSRKATAQRIISMKDKGTPIERTTGSEQELRAEVSATIASNNLKLIKADIERLQYSLRARRDKTNAIPIEERDSGHDARIELEEELLWQLTQVRKTLAPPKNKKTQDGGGWNLVGNK